MAIVRSKLVQHQGVYSFDFEVKANLPISSCAESNEPRLVALILLADDFATYRPALAHVELAQLGHTDATYVCVQCTLTLSSLASCVDDPSGIATKLYVASTIGRLHPGNSWLARLADATSAYK